jgi:hypothetical protein
MDNYENTIESSILFDRFTCLLSIANSAQPNWEDINLGETFFSYPLRYIRLFFDKKLQIVFKNFNILLTI